MGLNLGECLWRTAQRFPDKTAVVFEETRLSYAELCAAAMRVRNALHARGLQPGDRVALMLGNTPHFPIVYYGVLFAGGTVVTLNPGLRPKELAHHLRDSGASMLFVWYECAVDAAKACVEAPACKLLVNVEPGLRPETPAVGESFVMLLMSGAAEGHLAETRADDIAVVLYTSAMRGTPLGAQLSHFNLFNNAEVISRDVLKYYPDDICMGVLPLFHSFGQTCMMNAAFLCQCTLVLVPRFDGHRVYEAIARDRVSLLAMVPTMFHFLVNYKKDEALDLSSVRVAITGGAPMPPTIAQEFERRFGKPILEGYGLTETSPVVAFNRDAETNRPGSVGTVVPGTDIRVVRADGSIAGPTEIGELEIRGGNVMQGYRNVPEVNAEVLADGWLRSGDYGYIDEEGFIHLTGLKKQMVIRAGMNVYPREVEGYLSEHPEIAASRVVGVPDPVRGQEVKAYIVPRPGSTLGEKDLAAWCRDRFAAYKCPKRFEFVPALPEG